MESIFFTKKFVLVALLGCETQVINIVISCNCLLLLITFYSQNISRLFLAAGNIIFNLMSSSEIKRDTSFFLILYSSAICQHGLPKKIKIKEMQASFFFINILANALSSLRISPLLLIRIATIALLYAAALSFNVVYIQSIGSGIGIFSGLFLFSMLPFAPQFRKSQFTLFGELKQKLGFENEISDTWLQWFIGFTEGDGAILSYKGQPQFVITQKEGKILYEIQSVLGFGTVRHFPEGEGYYRYIITDIKGILLLCLLFNGNLVLPYRVEQLGQWVIDLNSKLSSPRSQIYKLIPLITAITDTTNPSLKDAWLSGFTDAE